MSSFHRILPPFVFLFSLLVVHSQTPAELVGHWKLDEGAGSVFKDSAGDHDGFLVTGNLPQFSDDVPPTTFNNPYSLNFTAASQQLVQTTFEGIDEDNPRTISAWIKTNSTSGQTIAAYGARDGNGRKWHFRINPDGAPRVPGAVRTEAQGGNQTGDTDLSDGQWHLVVSVFDGTDNIDVMHYVDGLLEGETGTTDEPIFTGIGDPFPLVSIGARQQSPPNYDNFMNGNLDDVRIYNRALSENEIMNLGSNPTDDGLVAYWNFDDGPGSQIAKDAVADNDGELRSELAGATIEWINDGPPAQNAAVEFSGDNSWIQTEFEGVGGNEPRTITFWMRTEVADDAPSHGVVGYGDSTDTHKFHVRVNNNAGNGELGAIRTEVQGGQNVSTTPINDGDWHHIAVVFPDGGEFNSDVIHIVDGEVDDQSGGGDQTVDTLIGPGAEPFTMGMRVQGTTRQFFPGALADVRFYNEELDLETIRAIMAGENPGGLKGDFNSNNVLDVEDIDLLSEEVRNGSNMARFDLNNDTKVDRIDHRIWVKDLRNTWFGDANLDDEFNSTDFVVIFQKGKFESDVPASWGDGDWNGDGRFDSSDFVFAFQDGGYELGPPPAAHVPEPSAFCLLLVGLTLGLRRRCGTRIRF